MNMYTILIGETGNEQGHMVPNRATTDAGAIRAAKRACAAYSGDGWWIVSCDGHTVARGGRDTI